MQGVPTEEEDRPEEVREDSAVVVTGGEPQSPIEMQVIQTSAEGNTGPANNVEREEKVEAPQPVVPSFANVPSEVCGVMIEFVGFPAALVLGLLNRSWDTLLLEQESIWQPILDSCGIHHIITSVASMDDLSAVLVGCGGEEHAELIHRSASLVTNYNNSASFRPQPNEPVSFSAAADGGQKGDEGATTEGGQRQTSGELVLSPLVNGASTDSLDRLMSEVLNTKDQWNRRAALAQYSKSAYDVAFVSRGPGPMGSVLPAGQEGLRKEKKSWFAAGLLAALGMTKKRRIALTGSATEALRVSTALRGKRSGETVELLHEGSKIIVEAMFPYRFISEGNSLDVDGILYCIPAKKTGSALEGELVQLATLMNAKHGVPVLIIVASADHRNDPDCLLPVALKGYVSAALSGRVADLSRRWVAVHGYSYRQLGSLEAITPLLKFMQLK